MVPLMNWMERKLIFSVENGVLPAVSMRLRGAVDRLEALVPQLSNEILIRKPIGGWSIQEHIGHLSDLEPLHLEYVSGFLVGASILRAGDPCNHKTEAAGHNERSIEELVECFMYRRYELVARLESLDAHTLTQTALHPRLNRQMRPVEVACFIAEHDDHHFARMYELMDKRSSIFALG